MSALRMLFAQREAKLAIAVWVIIPTLFLFFALTLAVDPSTQIDKVSIGITVLDAGVQTPQGTVSVGGQLAGGLHNQIPVQAVQYTTEADLRNAVLSRHVSGGIIFPENMTRDLQAHQPVQITIVKSDASDQFTGLFMTNIASQLSANLDASLPGMLGGQPSQPLVTTVVATVATAADFRFSVIPAVLVLPIWIATLAFSVLLSRAGASLRRTQGVSAMQGGLVELGVSAIGALIVAVVITLDIALFMWRWDIDFVGLAAFLWIGLLASAWLVQGMIRLFGLELGAALGLIGLFVQQPVSGASYPPSFAPDVVRWLADFSPLRYMVEGIRNILIGGSTTPDMTLGLALLAGAGLLIFAGGIARLSFIPSRQRPPQPVHSV